MRFVYLLQKALQLCERIFAALMNENNIPVAFVN